MNKIIRVLKNIWINPRMILAYMNAAGIFKFLPDKFVIKLLWWTKSGQKLNLKEPSSFNEKIQWLKLYNRDEKMTMMVDKYAVREYIGRVIGEEYLIPIIGVWDFPEQIDFENLPNQFVLKCNHNAAVGLCICRDKTKIDIKYVCNELKRGLKKNFYYSSREWAYKNVTRKVICEKYMQDGQRKSLRDYKFFCFNGEAKFIYMSEGLENHDSAKISFYNLEGEKMPFYRSDYKQFDKQIVFPENLDEMTLIANKLAKDINVPFVRIDLYSIENKVYFSEITFYPNSGYIPFEPYEWDKIIGGWIKLPN